MDIRVGKMIMGMVQTNTYFVYQEGRSQVICFDPADQGEKIYAALESKGFSVAAVFLTHGHFDHICGCEALVRAAAGKGQEPVKIYACEDERELLSDPEKNVSAQTGRPVALEADVYVRDGEVYYAAGMNCRVITTPGHTAGGCCYYFEEAGILISGDTLFHESVGRTDLPTGNMGTLVRSIREKLLVLPEDTKVYPGHGESTTIGYEKKYNPFCA